MTALPAEVTVGKVVGRFRRAVIDSADAGSEPDAVPEVGGIKFVPKLPYQRVLLPAPETVGSFSGIFELDAEGYLVDSQGVRGVWLPTGHYDITFAFKKTRISPTTILVTADHTELAPLDLALSLPLPGPALTQSQYSELSNRLETAVEAEVIAYLTANPAGIPDHNDTTLRDAADAHPLSAITGLVAALAAKATALQGELADSAVQPGDLADVATSGDYDDLVNRPTFKDVTNRTGATIPANTLVEIIGSFGVFPTIRVADAATADHVSGITVAAIADNASGSMQVDGEVQLLNTSALADGAILFLGAAGAFTDTRPVAPDRVIRVGVAGVIHPTAGSAIFNLPSAEIQSVDVRGVVAQADLTVTPGASISGENTGDEPNASTTVKGIVELATNTETTTGTDTVRAVTPAGVKAVADTKAAASHDHDAAAISSGTLDVYRLPWASTIAKGIAELATSAETIVGADSGRVVTPGGLWSAFDAWIADYALLSHTHDATTRVVLSTGSTAITAASTDHGYFYRLTAATAVTITLPIGVAIGTQIEYQATAAGLATFVLGAGASWGPAPVPSAVMLDTGSACTAICVSGGTWTVVGRLA